MTRTGLPGSAATATSVLPCAVGDAVLIQLDANDTFQRLGFGGQAVGLSLAIVKARFFFFLHAVPRRACCVCVLCTASHISAAALACACACSPGQMAPPRPVWMGSTTSLFLRQPGQPPPPSLTRAHTCRWRSTFTGGWARCTPSGTYGQGRATPRPCSSFNATCALTAAATSRVSASPGGGS